MDWRQQLIVERNGYSKALQEQRLMPGQNWPASQQHYLDRIEQINRILSSSSGDDAANLPPGRVTRVVI
jgi:hypothetical protein